MAVTWHMLASGSSGNSSVLVLHESALLIDAGLPPRRLQALLRESHLDWSQIGAMLLTHTHSDHWHPGVLDELLARRIPLFCHPSHRAQLQLNSSAFVPLALAGLVRYFEPVRKFTPVSGIACTPVSLRHDGGATFGFRLEGRRATGSDHWALGYAADLGSWDRDLSKAFADVDILALEFNHDVDLQRASRRPPWLVARVLGDHGHLSNHQGARLLRECLEHSRRGRLRHVVPLHVSRDCHRPELAASVARAILDEFNLDARLHTTCHGVCGPRIEV